MKTLRKMKVINWHYFDEEEISFGAATMLSGHSGAGKSTLLDALQYLFIGSQTQTRFNAAATQEARRTLLHYLRGKIKAEGVQYLRADEFTSYIALEFYDDVKRNSFIVGYVVDVFHDDRMQEEFFLIDQHTLSDLDFRNTAGTLYTQETFHRRYAHGSSVFETGKKQWQKRLMNRLGQLSSRFLPAFSRAIAFRPIDQVRDFIYEYVLLPRDLKLDVLREVFYSYQKFERDLQDLRARNAETRNSRRRMLPGREMTKSADGMSCWRHKRNGWKNTVRSQTHDSSCVRNSCVNSRKYPHSAHIPQESFFVCQRECHRRWRNSRGLSSMRQKIPSRQHKSNRSRSS